MHSKEEKKNKLKETNEIKSQRQKNKEKIKKKKKLIIHLFLLSVDNGKPKAARQFFAFVFLSTSSKHYLFVVDT